MFTNPLFFVYFSPETLLPVGSILATVAGIGMMLGRGSVRFLIRCGRRCLRSSARVAKVSRPHFRLGRTADVRASQGASDSRA
jgi:hypothetical protein